MDAIAVVGLGCVLPGARSASEFWKNVLAGEVSLTRVPSQAWAHSLYYSPDRLAPDRTHCDLGGFVSDFSFDWRKFRVPPADVQAVNPMQWMILDAGTQALSQAGVLPRDRTSIIIGATGLGWQRDSGLQIRLDDMLDAVRATEEFRALPPDRRDELLEVTERRLRARLKEVSEDNVVGASASVAAGRLNMHFDLKGPHYSVDAGFASSLAALDLAVRGLRDGEFDLAVAGGASEMLTPLEFIAFSKLGGLSGSGIRPFDASADGTILGEGVALFALKRLSDAERDGNTIHALVRGVAGSSDGRGKSLVAPRSEGQALAMRRALADAGPDFTAASVGYVECHATGTQVGDASEVRALTSAYSDAAGARIALGSVKANIGHLRSAAGAAGLLKAVLSLHHGQIPPQPSLGSVNPKFELERTPFFIPEGPTPYPSGQPARAAVSAFSFGGNNFHAVLEAYTPTNRPHRPVRRTAFEPMAIIGLGGLFPGAEDVPGFWERLLEGMDRTQTVPKDRYDIERYVDPKGERKDKSYTRIGCFLDALPTPDPSMRIPPAAWGSLDPSHTMCLKATDQALKDAGYAPGRWDPDRVALSLAFLPYQGKKFLADTRVHWTEFEHELAAAMAEGRLSESERNRVLRAAEQRYKADLPAITEDTLTGYLGSLNAGRIAWLHDFHGPHFVVDSACASAHAAFHAAARMLSHRVADVVLSGGVWCDMRPEFFIAACRFNALSSRGSFPFDASADGFIPGEGAGIVVLKRLADAERDGDRIRAVIRSVAGSSDGKGRSVLAPSREGEALAMRRALEEAQISPATVEYVECHGTGTALGDVVEANATADVYGEGRARPISIGSVKSNIGHLNAAAGVAALMKATLAVEHGVLPPSLKCETKNPKIPDTVEVVSERREWPSGPDGGPRRAGVSAFGVGGSNFHLIVEEYRAPAPQPHPQRQGTTALLAFTGRDAAACLAALDEHVKSCTRDRALLVDTTQVGEGSFRLAVTAHSVEELARKAQLFRHAVQSGGPVDFLAQSGIFAADSNSPLAGAPVALTFPGQGGQYANMLRELSAAYPSVRETLDEADRHYQALCGRPLTASFFTDASDRYEQPDEDIHTAVLAVNVALARLIRQFGIRPSFLIGQSAGELAALVEAESLSFEDALRAMRARTLAVLALPTRDPGRMAALSCSSEEVPALLEGLPGYAALAADNGPRACIVSADRAAMEALVSRCADRGIECSVLAVSHGYHSKLIADARPSYRQELEQIDFAAPRTPLVSTIDAKAYADRPVAQFPAFLASQFVEPVRLRAAWLNAHRLGARVFLEAGPKWSLTQFARETLKDLPHGAMASLHPKVGEVEQFKRLIGFCFVHRLGQLTPAHSEKPPTMIEDELFAMPLREVLSPEAARKIAAALGKRFGVDTSSASAAELATLDTIVALVERLRAGGEAPAPVSAPVSAPVAADASAVEAEIQRVLLAAVVVKTGYPEEMLGLDLDLEADLGIDTVKQVDVFANVRAHFGVPRDPNMTLRDFNTLRKVVHHLRDQVLAKAPAIAAAPPPPPAIASAPPAPTRPPEVMHVKPAANPFETIKAVLIRNVVEKTGYPEEMLELDLDLEADLGIDTVKQVDVFGRTRAAFGIERDPNAALRDFNTLRKVIEHMVSRLPAGAAPAVQLAEAVRAAGPANGGPSTGSSAPPPASGGAGSSVRATLLSMALDELGLGAGETRRLTDALAQRLGVAAPDTARVRTLSELVDVVSHQKGRA